MTRHTQKSSRQRKRQYTRRVGGAPRGKWIYKWFCIVRNGIEQCIRGRKKNNNNDNKYYDQDGFLITEDYVVKNNKNNKNNKSK